MARDERLKAETEARREAGLLPDEPLTQDEVADRNPAGLVTEPLAAQYAEQAGHEAEAAASYSEGDVVEYDSEGHVGVVLEVHTSDFTPPEEGADDDSYEVADGETVYVVARETEGFGYYTDSDLAAGEFPDTPGDPAGDLSDRAADSDVEAAASNDDLSVQFVASATLEAVGTGVPGWIGFPPSWEKSKIPARIILLDAWTSMGATWTGAYETFQKGNTRRGAKKLASSMKDEVYGTTYWR